MAKTTTFERCLNLKPHKTKVHLFKFMVNCFFSHFYQVCISKRFFHSRSSHFTFGSDCTVCVTALLSFFSEIFGLWHLICTATTLQYTQQTNSPRNRRKLWTFCKCFVHQLLVCFKSTTSANNWSQDQNLFSCLLGSFPDLSFLNLLLILLKNTAKKWPTEHTT